jgi:hypothetical protein
MGGFMDQNDSTRANRRAANLLRTYVAAAQLTEAPAADQETREALAEALNWEFPDLAEPSPDADPVQAALDVIENDPDLQERIRDPRFQERATDFSSHGELLGQSVLVMMVLSTYIALERDKEGKWLFKFRLTPQSTTLKKAILNLVKAISQMNAS